MSGMELLFFSRAGNRLLLVLESLKFFARGDRDKDGSNTFYNDVIDLIQSAQSIAKEIDASTQAFKRQSTTPDQKSSALNALNVGISEAKDIVGKICQIAELRIKDGKSKNPSLLEYMINGVNTEMGGIEAERLKLSKQAEKSSDGPASARPPINAKP